MIEESLKWRGDRLKDIATINMDALSANTEPDYELEYLEISNVNYYGVIDSEKIETMRYEVAPSRARRRVKNNNTIISSVRPNLQAAAYFENVSENFICSTGFNVIQPNEAKVVPKFLYYALISENGRQYFEAAAKGVGYPAIDDKDFSSFYLSIPLLNEQNMIVKYLDTSINVIDEAINIKREQLKTIDELCKVTITDAIIKGINRTVRNKFSGQDWLGNIPSHWSACSLKRLIREPLTYGLNEAAEMEERYLPRYLRITDFDENGNLREDTFRSLPQEVAQAAMLKENDVLFARSGATSGKTFLFRNYDGEACFAGYLICARTQKWKLDPLYLYYFTKTKAYDTWKSLIFTQATIQNISAAKYNYLTIPLPPISEQKEICEFIEDKNREFQRVLEHIKNQVSILVEYRKSLIYECITGQRRISESDIRRVCGDG